MSTYGITRYGTDYYGPARPVTVVPGGSALPTINNAYLIDPFTATPIDYQSVLLQWTTPVAGTSTPMTEFRLLSSRWGFPVDQNDGNVVFDTASSPGNHYVDQNVVPGQMTYYGFYINTGTSWVRSGFTACLMPKSYDYAGRLWSYLPPYLRDQGDSELTADSAGDTYLAQFLAVAGFSLDYLKTQYDFLFAGQNSPMKMSFSDLADLAGQLGMPFSGEIPAYFLRKAVDNWTTVMRERGTLAGIAEHISLLTGFGADIQLARNIMLENDQSGPRDPRAADWSNGIPYQVGEMVKYPVYPAWVQSQSYIVNNFVVYNGVNYSCIATGGQGVPPVGAVTSATYWAIAAGPYVWKCTTAVTSLPGGAPAIIGAAGSTPTANTGWQIVYDQDAATSYLAISGLVGGVNTWEVLTATTGSTTPSTAGVPASTLLEGLGLHNPLNFSNDWSQNSFRVTNRGGSTADTWLRSVSRQASDITSGSAVPDPQLVVEHGIPVPQNTDAWSSSVRYSTGSVAAYGSRNYLALRASTGAVPPSPGVPLNMNWDFETTVSPWTGHTGGTVTKSFAHNYHGTASMLITPDGTSAQPGAQSEYLPVIPNATYKASTWVLVPAGYSTVQLCINWYDPFGTYITTSFTGASVAAATWTKITCPATAPQNAANAQIIPQLGSTPASSVLSYWDLVKLTCTATPEWQQLGTDSRIPLVLSAEAIQDVSIGSAEQYAIYPFVEWYDNWGNLITRVFARTAVTAGGTPGSYTYDAFDGDANMPLAGRGTDTADQTWLVTVGDWTVSGAGTVYPASPSVSSRAVVAAPTSCTQAVTFATGPDTSGRDCHLLVWYVSESQYWHAGMTGLWYSAGSDTDVATYATAFQPGDRMYVVTSQTAPSITVYRNVIGAYVPATGNGQVAQVAGLSVPATPNVTAATGGSMAAGTYHAEVTYVTAAGETTASSAASITTTVISPPATPAPTFVTTGGTVAAGTYKVEVTYVSASGETTASAFGSVTTTGAASKITIPSPSAATGATGWYAYVTQVGGSTYTRQQALGSPTAIGTSLVISAPPTSSGSNPPVSNTSGTSEITITSPAATANATGWYAYVTQVGGSTFTRQQTVGSPTAIGTNLTLTAPPTSSGANPPGSNTSGLAIASAAIPTGQSYSGIEYAFN